MKDIVISGKRVKAELIIMAVCFIIAFFTNVGAVLYYHRPWIEVLSQIGFVIVIAAGLYLLSLMARMVWYVIRLFFFSKNKKTS